ncbi:drug/metabolite transporter (DMT)-like permease [Chitinophaga skermanii]|uniref:Drug/metabolite transporter (DMT)-like permease n=1 Tax=Chitinophaga skermanii TaxID=331697 RepID=A0A327QZ22_9BACT|nr:EamA family transporter [Chitinophaga skermanii]RAJ08904.1 drug/metabolite transporter (DMT)-like permease [Chitinophaga skermanii]
MKKPSVNAYVALIVVSFFWGTTYLASHIGVEYMHGLLLAGLRQSMAGVLLTGFFFIKGQKIPPRAMLSKLFIIGVIMLCGSNGLMTWAMKYVPSGLGAIIAATVPIWITIFSYFIVSKSKITAQVIIGMLIGFIGVGGIFYDYLVDLMKPEFRFGILLLIMGSMFWAFGSVLTAKWALGINPLYGAGFQMFFSGVVMLIISFCMGETLQWSHLQEPRLVGSILYLIFVGSLLSYSAYIYALNSLPPSQVAIYAYVNPIVAVLLGFIILQEKLNMVVAISCLVTLVGVYLVNNAYKKNKQYGQLAE